MRILMALATVAVAASTSSADAYDCPRATVVVPYPAGGATDVAARIVADGLEAITKKSFIIENRAGATGNIGTVAVVNAKPDGCTLLVNAAVIATFPASFSKLGYDPIRDLVPVGGIGITPTLLVAAKTLPADDLVGLAQLSKQRPDGLNYSTAGYGLLQHLAVEEMAQRSGAKFVHVVYRGGAQAASDLVAGRVDFGSFAAGSMLQFVRAGQLKPLAVIQARRSALLPDVPSAAELGMTRLDAGVHFMLYAPAAVPSDVLSLLNSGLSRVVGDPALKQRFANAGFDASATSPDEAMAIMRNTGEAWAPLIKRLNIRLD